MPEELHELLLYIYGPHSDLHSLSSHALAVVFFIFAHAALMDIARPAYCSQADAYFDLGRTAVALQSVVESTDLRTIQALALAGLYYATGGPRYSFDSSWTIISMAMGLCQRVARICRFSTVLCHLIQGPLQLRLSEFFFRAAGWR
jgi:hypothetical protein